MTKQWIKLINSLYKNKNREGLITTAESLAIVGNKRALNMCFTLINKL